MLISIVIRTLNESRHLEELLLQIRQQRIPNLWRTEVVLVDSGSTDGTIEIAQRHDCAIVHIAKRDFSFGRSLNLGCDTSSGDIMVFVSGHCVPAGDQWLFHLVSPVAKGAVQYSYGRQIGRDTTKFSERQVFKKYFPDHSIVPQQGIFANNANAAVSRAVFERFRFDEELTGLEDMYLAKQLVGAGGQVGYVSEATVYHIHDETWQQVQRRYEREAIALVEFMPHAAIGLADCVACYLRAIVNDAYWAAREGDLFANLSGILLFRFNQYWGGYKGSRIGREVARIHSKDYFYPDRKYIKPAYSIEKTHSPDANEGTQ